MQNNINGIDYFFNRDYLLINQLPFYNRHFYYDSLKEYQNILQTFL